jgi:hypothetical protein
MTALVLAIALAAPASADSNLGALGSAADGLAAAVFDNDAGGSPGAVPAPGSRPLAAASASAPPAGPNIIVGPAPNPGKLFGKRLDGAEIGAIVGAVAGLALGIGLPFLFVAGGMGVGWAILAGIGIALATVAIFAALGEAFD